MVEGECFWGALEKGLGRWICMNVFSVLWNDFSDGNLRLENFSVGHDF